MNKSVILAVDDEAFNLQIIDELLCDKFEVHCLDSGEACLEHIEKINPSILLLDVAMPGLNGYQVCQAIKENPRTRNIAVMFLSAGSTLDDRIAGYNAGGEDYIVKPFAREELEAKLVHLAQHIDAMNDLEGQLQHATDVAFNIMANNSEIGQVVQYVERLTDVTDYPELAKELMSALAGFGIRCVVSFRLSEQNVQYHASCASVSPIVTELFEMLKDRGRIFTFGSRVMFNFKYCSFLVLDIPERDDDFVGRVRDHLCFIGTTTDQALNALVTDNQLMQQRKMLHQTLDIVNHRVNGLIEDLNASHVENEQIFRELQEKFDTEIPRMGLEDDQELYIFDSLDDTIQRSVHREDKLLKIKSSFADMESELSSLFKLK